MIEWGKVPWTLWVLASLSVAELILFVAQIHGPVLPRVFYPVFILAWLFFLLKGLRCGLDRDLGFSFWASSSFDLGLLSRGKVSLRGRSVSACF